MENKSAAPVTFELSREHVEAVEKLAGGRQVRLSGQISAGKLVIDSIGFADQEFSKPVFVAVNAPFKTAQQAAA